MSYDIFEGFHDGLEEAFFLINLSKAFDQAWHEGLIYKLRRNGTSGKQRVLLNGQYSSWGFINTGVPKGSTLGPLL